jgi:3-hydroxyisobutyrate dehydrogenase-like beta-hydroxyacid dehydrogenase
MRLIAELAGELGVPAPALELAAATFERAAAAGHGADDFSIVAQLHAAADGATLPIAAE